MIAATCHPERRHKANGQCAMCYERRRKGSMATCHPDRLRSGRSRTLCRPCYREQVTEPARRVAARRRDLKRFYGITPEEYDALLEAQGGVCAICGRAPRHTTGSETIARLAVDHDHETGILRGLLCTTCNRLLGLAEDDPELLRVAIAYLVKLRAARSA